MEPNNRVWRPYDEDVAPPLHPSQFAQLSAEPFRYITDPKIIGLADHIGNAIGAVGYLSDFAIDNEVYDFPVNDGGLKYVEQYLTNMVKPYILKWGGSGGLTPKLKKAQSLMPDPEFSIDARFFLASRVLGQCLAQQHGLYWTPDGEALMRDPQKPQRDIEVWSKVRKFLKFGKEDCFGGFSVAIANKERNTKLLTAALKQLKEEEGLTIPDGCTYQMWTNVEGRLESVVIKEPKTGKILQAVKFVDERELKVANPQNMEELMRVGIPKVH